MTDFIEWVRDSKLSIEWVDKNIFKIDSVGNFLLLDYKDPLFDDEFNFLLSDKEENFKKSIDYLVFQFGGKFYYSKPDKVLLTPFKYLGKATQDIEESFTYLGIHGEFELLNGSRKYSDWCKKAKFLGYNTLGICEKNTLAGVLKFQLDCLKNKIKPIIGCSVVVRLQSTNIIIKLYVINEIGWRNLLLINKEINVINKGWVDQKIFFNLLEGLVLVLSPHYKLDSQLIYDLKKVVQDNLYYQIDSVEWRSNSKESEYLLNIKDYLNNYYSKIEPILINDSYYLDKEDSVIKTKLNLITTTFDYNSEDQYFKNLDDNFNSLSILFKNSDERLFDLFQKSLENTNKIGSICNFQIQMGVWSLPKFNRDHLPEEFHHIKSNEELFYYLIEKGFNERCKDKDLDKYTQRIELELDVILKGGFIDYFLILWDIIRWCKENSILTGIARGSAGGSLVAYITYIINIDPLEFNLLFERFLNTGRISSPPDIDCDFPASRKDEVKQYMKQLYGEAYFCSVGTYTTLQLKAVLRDLGRVESIELSKLNYISKLLESSGNQSEDDSWQDFFTNAIKNDSVKQFIKENPELINNIQLCIGQPRSKSIHACATIILPKDQDRDIFTWIPVRDESGVLVSEWEGSELEKVGLLKEDILGIRELDKFKFIIDLIKETTNDDIDIYSIPFDDKEVYELFQQGLTANSFHFGSKSLTAYCQLVLPEKIEDLIAILAIYRPGPIYINAHNEFVSLKNGERQVEYDYGTKEITKDTYGLYIYQEQIMQVCQKVAGFDLVEADDIRKAMGKLDRKLIDTYKSRFISGAIKNSCPEEEANLIWDKMENFASYCFNKSHSAAYAITGYIAQWLKSHYPVQFWTAAFEFEDDSEEITRYISEINRSQNSVNLLSPDINRSGIKFSYEVKTNSIFWSLLHILQCGESVISEIITERDLSGEFFSFEEFYKRVNKSKVNKRVVEHIILCGGFDLIENISKPQDRLKLIKKYRKLSMTKIDLSKDLFEVNISKLDTDYWWSLQQKNLCNLAFFDYRSIIKRYTDFHKYKYLDYHILINERSSSDRLQGCIGGVIKGVIIRSSKKGEFAQIQLDINSNFIWVIFWSEIWSKFKPFIEGSEKKILVVNGRIAYDAYKKENILQTEESTEIKILS